MQISGDASKYSIPPPEARYQNIQNWGEKRDRVILLKVQCCIYIFGGAGNKIFCKMKSTSNKNISVCPLKSAFSIQHSALRCMTRLPAIGWRVEPTVRIIGSVSQWPDLPCGGPKL